MTALSHGRPDRPAGSFMLLHREQVVRAPREEVFSFFADACNLDSITPPFLRFRILTERPIEMRRGSRIEYSLRIRGIPLRWESEITVWEPPHRFVDLQVRGPYRWWRHEHRFEEQGDDTKVIDEVEYACPGGRLVHALFVRRDLQRIFDYRRQRLDQIFRTSADRGIVRVTADSH